MIKEMEDGAHTQNDLVATPGTILSFRQGI